MKVKFDTTIFYVRNIQFLRDFYVENFNLKVIEQDDVWILLDAGNANIGFHKMGEEYLKKINENYQFDNNTKIVFEIDEDIEAVRKNFLNKNVPMREIKTFENYDFGLCDGIDPEGNVFQLKKRKL